MRKLAGLVLLLWALSSGAELWHELGGCCAHHRAESGDEAPCSICLTISHVPVIALPQPEALEARQDVGAWISPWLAMVPDEVFFDRPLARGPPSVS
jgi:hypothetical protein